MISTPLTGAEVRTLTNNVTGSRLNVIAARGMVFSSWRFSPEELAAVRSGKPVWVIMRGEIVPEFHLQVGDRNEIVPPEIIKRAQRQDAILKSPEGAEVLAKNKRKALFIEVLAWIYAAAVVIATVLVLWFGSLWAIAQPLGR